MKTTDKRGRGQEAGGDSASDVQAGQQEQQDEKEVLTGEVVSPEAERGRDYLEDLLRVQAEFENYRKRMAREQTAVSQRASARLVERLLPILDNFERAVEHGEAGPGIEMTVKELHKLLAEEGLEEIESEGRPFDPHVHEALQVVEEDGATEPMVRSVLRRGYRIKDQVLRPAMVQVVRPSGDDQERADAAEA